MNLKFNFKLPKIIITLVIPTSKFKIILRVIIFIFYFINLFQYYKF